MLTVLAWSWISLGTVFILMSLAIIVLDSLLPELSRGDLRNTPGLPFLPDELILRLLASADLPVQLLFPAAVVVAGILLLKRRAWARTWIRLPIG